MDVQALSGRFPDEFIFGAATASFQIEGAAKTDGRKPSIWDAFCNMPGRVFQRHNGDVACDHYNRLEEDLDLLKDLGLDAYRFSVAWPRVVPDGDGPINEAGLDFYDRLVDGLKSRNIKAMATLFHWDLPLALMGDGGWTSRKTPVAFHRYAKTVVSRLGDRLDYVATLNEPWCSVYLGHLLGEHAPGERSMDAALHALHMTNLAHGFGVDAVRSARPELPVGIVINAMATMAASDSAEDQAAAERAHAFHNGVFFDPIFNGAYPEEFMDAFGDRMPEVTDEDMDLISQEIEFWGLNYYTPMRVKADLDQGSEFPRTLPAEPVNDGKTDIGWEIDPSAFTALAVDLYQRYDLPDLYITENGSCYNMDVVDGVCDDQPRLDYAASHIAAAADMIEQGLPLKGYFAWSLMDNFEWAFGYAMRFGIVHVDYQTQVRTIKKSGQWYRDLADAHNRVNSPAAR